MSLEIVARAAAPGPWAPPGPATTAAERAIDEAARPDWNGPATKPAAAEPPPKTGMSYLLELARKMPASAAAPATVAAEAAPAITTADILASRIMPLEQRCQLAWGRDAALRAEFRGDFSTFVAFRRAFEAGRVKVYTGGAVQRFTAADFAKTRG